jgi:short-subunit dehydrogenase
MTLPSPAPDRTCLITGASSGIGADLARELARRGHGVTLVARREAPLRELAEELATAHAIRAEVVAADLTEVDERRRLVEEAGKRGLTVDVLVNNAGFSTMGPVHRSDPTREVAMLRTDVEAVAHLCSALLPGMVERGRGAVLNVASTAAFQPLPGQAGYGGSKAFVLSYSQALAEEVRRHGVTVTVLCPGPVETEFAEVMGLTDEEASSSLPRFMWVSSADVAAQAIAGLDKGRGVVIPGAPNWIGAGFARFVPRRLLLPVLASRHPSLRD